jgi:hypothetical protein
MHGAGVGRYCSSLPTADQFSGRNGISEADASTTRGDRTRDFAIGRKLLPGWFDLHLIDVGIELIRFAIRVHCLRERSIGFWSFQDVFLWRIKPPRKIDGRVGEAEFMENFFDFVTKGRRGHLTPKFVAVEKVQLIIVPTPLGRVWYP